MEEEGVIKINTAGIKGSFGRINDFFKGKKIVWAVITALFLVFLVWGSTIRLQNADLLKDSTTGKYLPADPDSIYFLRIAETLNNEGGLPKYDTFRQPYNIPYPKELLPLSVVYIYKIAKVFDNSITLEFSDVVLFPIVFFILGLITFFLFVYALTKSKITALISSVFLAVIPSYIFRTMPGVSDHEPIGMFSFFLALFAYSMALKFLDKEEKSKSLFLKTIFFSVSVGFLSSLTIASWGGIANFLFMIIPLSFGLFWLIKSQKVHEISEVKKEFLNYLVFYIGWFIFTILFSLFFGYGLRETLSRVTLGSTSVLTGFFLLFILIDFFLILKKDILRDKLKKYRVLVSFIGTLVLGVIILVLIYGGVLSIFEDAINRLLHPFGTDRVSVTVSENQQPYLNDWISQIGKTFFWLFFAGLVAIGINISSSFSKNKQRFLFVFFWTILIFGILFSRISSGSMFNGVNLASRLFYFGSFILFFAYLTRIYFKEKIEINAEKIIIFSWAIFMLIAARGAVRTFFLITPFTCFSASFLVVNLFDYVKKRKEELLKMLLSIMLIVVIILSLLSLNGFVKASTAQAQGKGPIGGSQWQNAMAWVRDNTVEGSIFVHWWDYGYMVQYMGKRPTLADGGHFEGAFRDHLIGRYLLTNPNPESALSFMKTNNVSYLLIDPTDIGKYGAYSSIGSDNSGTDRSSYLPIMILNPSQTQETNSSEIRFYQGAAPLDQDIIYNKNGENVFLPAGRAIIVGFILETIKGKNSFSFKQPEAVFFYNEQQIRIPIRYVYFDGQMLDFKNGLGAGVYLIPLINPTGGQNIQINQFGAAVYMSPKVFNGLFAQLYLMDDPFKRYTTVKIAHSEPDPFIASMNSQGAQLGEFVFFNGVRGPIKIWKTDYPENIIAKDEFLRQSGEYAEFDDLTVTR